MVHISVVHFQGYLTGFPKFGDIYNDMGLSDGRHTSFIDRIAFPKEKRASILVFDHGEIMPFGPYDAGQIGTVHDQEVGFDLRFASGIHNQSAEGITMRSGLVLDRVFAMEHAILEMDAPDTALVRSLNISGRHVQRVHPAQPRGKRIARGAVGS